MTNQLQHQGVPLEERRDATRFERLPEDDFAAIWMGSEEPQLAEVHDESLHGISLILDTAWNIGIGCQVHIVYAGICHLAQVRHVEPLTDNRVIVGFYCEPAPDMADYE